MIALHVQAVLGFVDGDAARRIHHRVGGLYVAAQRQAVRKDAVIGQRHLGFIDDEVLVAVADGLLRLPVAEERQRAPTLCVHHIGIAICTLRIVADRQAAAIVGHVLPGKLHVARIKKIFVGGTQQGHVHAHAGGDGQRRIGHRGVQRLRVVGPGQHILLAAQVAGAEAFLQRQRVRQLLAGMGDGLHVDDRHRRILRKGLQDDVLAVALPVDELRERAHADQVHVAPQHPRHFRDVLFGVAVHHRAEVEFDRPGVLARLQHDGMPAQLERAQLEAGAGAHRRVEEHQRDRAAFQRIPQRLPLETRGIRQQRIELGALPVLGIEEVLHSECLGWGGLRWPETKKPSRRAGFRKVTRTHAIRITQRDVGIPVGARARSCRMPSGRSLRGAWRGGRSSGRDARMPRCSMQLPGAGHGPAIGCGVIETRTRRRLPGSCASRVLNLLPL